MFEDEENRIEQRQACLRALCVSQSKLGEGKLEGHISGACCIKACIKLLW